ncbi:MAG TPA: papain-like cysteine protease family protein [Xanthobacteraceae bacterium]|nr:papain-like cysteine protease family protein [Xanthobacteraceae bacterium]
MMGRGAFLPLIAKILLAFVIAGHAGEIALPWIKQKTATECGRAVLASVAARHGGDVEQFYRELPAPPDRKRGYSILDVKKFAATIGINLSVLQPDGITIAGECSERPPVTAYFAKLTDVVDAGHPVIVATGDSSSRGHYLVLVGAGSGKFIALDPSTPERRTIGFRSLRSMMCGFGYVALAVQD